MNKFFLPMLLLCIVLFCKSCQNTNRTLKEEANSKFLHEVALWDIEPVDQINVNEIFTFEGYTFLRTPDSIPIGQIDEVLIYEDYIYILDQMVAKQVFRFNRDGSFDKIIGSVGKGIGEYQRPDDISINQDDSELLVYSRQNRVVLHYDLVTGDFLHVNKLNFAAHEIQPIGNDRYAVFNHDIHNLNSVENDNDYNLLIVGKDFSKIYSRRLPLNVIEGEGKSVISTGRYFNLLNDSLVLVNWRFNDTVYKVTSSSFEPFVYFDFGDKRVQYSNYEESKAGPVLEKLKSGVFSSVLSNVHIVNNLLLTRIVSAQFHESNGNINPLYVVYDLESRGKTFVCRSMYDSYLAQDFIFPVSVSNNNYISVIYSDNTQDWNKDSQFFKEFEKEYGFTPNKTMKPILLFYKPK